MIKSKRLIRLLTFISLFISATATLLFGFNAKVKAQETFSITPGCFDEYTDSLNLYDETTGANLAQTFDGYLNYFSERYSGNGIEANRDRLNLHK